MSLVEHRSKFTVFACLSDLDLAGEVRSTLSELNYECFTFSNLKTAKERFREARPHLLLHHLEDLESGIGQFLTEIREEAPELLVIGIGDIKERERLSRFFEYGVYDLVPLGVGFKAALGWSVDRAVQCLIYIYQNEQLLEQVSKSQSESLSEKSSAPPSNSSTAVPPSRVTKLLSDLGQAQWAFKRSTDAEELVERLLVQLEAGLGPQSSHLYFRYAPNAYSFLVDHYSRNLPADSKGVGFRLRDEEVHALGEWVDDPTGLASLSGLMKDAFGAEDFEATPIFLGKQLSALLVRVNPVELPLEVKDFYQSLLLSFQQQLEVFNLRKLSMLGEVRDELTGLFTGELFKPKLSDEVTRAQRLKMPVSIIHAGIDHLEELREQLISEDFIQCIRGVAEIMQKSSRTNDLLCRTGEGRFSLILPHTHKKGAAIRAERLRRLIESTPFASQSKHLTLSFGVAEYPSHALTVDEMDKLAKMGLDQVQAGRGNKVCLATSPPDFKPDFEISEA